MIGFGNAIDIRAGTENASNANAREVPICASGVVTKSEQRTKMTIANAPAIVSRLVTSCVGLIPRSAKNRNRPKLRSPSNALSPHRKIPIRIGGSDSPAKSVPEILRLATRTSVPSTAIKRSPIEFCKLCLSKTFHGPGPLVCRY